MGPALWLVVLATPVALVFETALRTLLFPADFEELRRFLQPLLTPSAWALGLLTVAAVLLGLGLQTRLSRERLERLGPDATVAQRERATLGVFLLTSSIPQIPALVSTLAYMFGSTLLPVLVGIGLCTLGVTLQARRVGTLADRDGPSPLDA